MNQIMKYQVSGQEVVLTEETVKRYLVNGDPSNVTDQELAMFMNLCKYQKLNPFLREAYLVKYGSAPATIVTGKETYTKRAAANPLCTGYKAGVILIDENKQLVYREGSFSMKSEEIVGGWAEVFRKDWDVPIRSEVAFEEYVGRKKDGSINSTWQGKPATMIRKVALVQALREAMPEEFSGTYSPEEISTIDVDSLNEEVVSIPEAEVEILASEYISEEQRNMMFQKFGARTDVIKSAMNHLSLGENSKKIPVDRFDKLMETIEDMIEVLDKEEA